MAELGRKPKPGAYHLMPDAALQIYPKRVVATTDWKNIDSYAGHENWSNAQWAWEFLRRNRFFQQDCDALKINLEKRTRKPPKLDSKWLLQEFKCYDERFSWEERKIEPPKWSIFSRVECWDTNIPRRLKGPQQPWVIEDLVLQPGQIALVLDLNGCAALPEVFKLQWSSAWYKMAASAVRLRKAEEKRRSPALGASVSAAGKKPSLPHRDKRIDYLRIADAFSLRFPATLEEVSLALHQEGRLRTGTPKNTKVAEFSMPRAKNSLYKMIAATRGAIYEQGYLLLLAEEAGNASWQEQIAPSWPHSKPAEATFEDAAWGKDVAKSDPKPPNPFAWLTSPQRPKERQKSRTI